MHIKVMAIVVMWLAVMMAGAPPNRAQCAIMSKESWRGVLLERLCCGGKLYLAQDGEITAQGGECPLSVKRKIKCSLLMTVWAIMTVHLWMWLTGV